VSGASAALPEAVRPGARDDLAGVDAGNSTDGGSSRTANWSRSVHAASVMSFPRGRGAGEVGVDELDGHRTFPTATAQRLGVVRFCHHCVQHRYG
jgi:hypothetical protein